MIKHNYLVDRIKAVPRVHKLKGARGVLRGALNEAKRLMDCARARLRSKKFFLNARRYSIFAHPYNQTWRNERAVEIPVVRAYLKEARGQKILEIGNVLSHYFSVSHEVVDKYEVAAGVTNEDIADYEPNKRYDLILSVSTLEHVGFDYGEQTDPKKILAAFAKVKKLLTPGGKAVVTLPLGYNPHFDFALSEEKIPFDEKQYLVRTANGDWIQTDENEARKASYGKPFEGANAILIGVIKR